MRVQAGVLPARSYLPALQHTRMRHRRGLAPDQVITRNNLKCVWRRRPVARLVPLLRSGQMSGMRVPAQIRRLPAPPRSHPRLHVSRNHQAHSARTIAPARGNEYLYVVAPTRHNGEAQEGVAAAPPRSLI